MDIIIDIIVANKGLQRKIKPDELACSLDATDNLHEN